LVDIIEALNCNEVDIEGNLLFASFGLLLTIFDITDPTNPCDLANFELSELIVGIDAVGDHVYTIDYDGAVWVVDVSVPTEPSLDTILPGVTTQRGEGVTWSDSCLYVCRGGDGLFLFDASIPSDPVQVGHFATDRVRDVAVQGNVAYLAEKGIGLGIVDVSDKSNPTEIGRYDRYQWYAWSIDVSGDYAFVTSWSFDRGVWIIDVSDPVNPFDVGHYGGQAPISPAALGGGRMPLENVCGCAMLAGTRRG
jgi:hypothetical protein